MKRNPIRIEIVATVETPAQLVAALKAAAVQPKPQCRTLDTPAAYEVTRDA